jgi:hypothetical protein
MSSYINFNGTVQGEGHFTYIDYSIKKQKRWENDHKWWIVQICKEIQQFAAGTEKN